MVDNIIGAPPVAAVGVQAQDPMQLSIRLRGSERGERRGSGHSGPGNGGSEDGSDGAESSTGDSPTSGDDRRMAAARAARAYGGAATVVRRQAEVVISRSAAMLTGDLESVLRRAGEAIRHMAETLLGIDASRTGGLVHDFRGAALHWVRDGLQRYRSYAENHERLPIGVAFEDVRLSLSAENGRLSLDVGGVEFRRGFDFRASGVVFDIRASGTVQEPSPGFFVDTGITGAATAHAIVETVRTELPTFGIAEDTEGVCVLIRAEASDFVTGRAATWVVEMDLLVPFNPRWPGGGVSA